jgi:hypothetical protein
MAGRGDVPGIDRHTRNERIGEQAGVDDEMNVLGPG